MATVSVILKPMRAIAVGISRICTSGSVPIAAELATLSGRASEYWVCAYDGCDSLGRCVWRVKRTFNTKDEVGKRWQVDIAPGKLPAQQLHKLKPAFANIVIHI